MVIQLGEKSISRPVRKLQMLGGTEEVSADSTFEGPSKETRINDIADCIIIIIGSSERASELPEVQQRRWGFINGLK